MTTIWRTLAVGVFSTLSMDLMTGAAVRLQLTAPLPPHLVGRWFAAIARGQLLHADIAGSPPMNHELLVALPAHYAIGTVLATLYVWGTLEIGWPSSLGTALTFGLCTNIFPWLLMFPAMGYGLFGAHGPAGTRLFVSSLVSHGFFGLGLWIAVRAANWLGFPVV